MGTNASSAHGGILSVWINALNGQMNAQWSIKYGAIAKRKLTESEKIIYLVRGSLMCSPEPASKLGAYFVLENLHVELEKT